MVQIKGKARDMWLWVALEAETKLMPVLRLGSRKQEVANGMMQALAGMLPPGCVSAFTSDGLNLYLYALTAHFGEWQETEVGKVRWVVSASKSCPHTVPLKAKRVPTLPCRIANYVCWDDPTSDFVLGVSLRCMPSPY